MSELPDPGFYSPSASPHRVMFRWNMLKPLEENLVTVRSFPVFGSWWRIGISGDLKPFLPPPKNQSAVSGPSPVRRILAQLFVSWIDPVHGLRAGGVKRDWLWVNWRYITWMGTSTAKAEGALTALAGTKASLCWKSERISFQGSVP